MEYVLSKSMGVPFFDNPCLKFQKYFHNFVLLLLNLSIRKILRNIVNTQNSPTYIRRGLGGEGEMFKNIEPMTIFQFFRRCTKGWHKLRSQKSACKAMPRPPPFSDPICVITYDEERQVTKPTSPLQNCRSHTEFLHSRFRSRAVAPDTMSRLKF